MRNCVFVASSVKSSAFFSRQWKATPLSRTKRKASSTRSLETFFRRSGSQAWSTLCSLKPWRDSSRGPK